MTEDHKLSFALKEYEEAAKAFIAGAQIAQNLLQSFLFGNGVLAALFGASAGLAKDSIVSARYVIPVIPAVGILSTILFVLMIPRYRAYLACCRRRCVEIEADLGGRLFTSIEALVARTGTLYSIVAIRVLGGIFTVFWTSVLIAVVCR